MKSKTFDPRTRAIESGRIKTDSKPTHLVRDGRGGWSIVPDLVRA